MAAVGTAGNHLPTDRSAFATASGAQANAGAFSLNPTWGALGQTDVTWSNPEPERLAVSEATPDPSAFYLGPLWGAVSQGNIAWSDSFSTIIRSNAYWG